MKKIVAIRHVFIHEQNASGRLCRCIRVCNVPFELGEKVMITIERIPKKLK